MPFFQTFWKIDFSFLSIIMNEVQSCILHAMRALYITRIRNTLRQKS
jgi:hypothetical protein